MINVISEGQQNNMDNDISAPVTRQESQIDIHRVNFQMEEVKEGDQVTADQRQRSRSHMPDQNMINKVLEENTNKKLKSNIPSLQDTQSKKGGVR